MEPNKFRESRLAINRLCENINILIDNKDLETSKESYQEVASQLDELKPQAEGEIQKRSVKNLSVKVNGLLTNIDKLKPKSKAGGKRKKKDAEPDIIWDKERMGQLAKVFLGKVFTNMARDAEAKVYFNTTGKGIRPSYLVEFSNNDSITFSGSGHSPLKKPLSAATKKISTPFSYEDIEAVLTGK